MLLTQFWRRFSLAIQQKLCNSFPRRSNIHRWQENEVSEWKWDTAKETAIKRKEERGPGRGYTYTHIGTLFLTEVSLSCTRLQHSMLVGVVSSKASWNQDTPTFKRVSTFSSLSLLPSLALHPSPQWWCISYLFCLMSISNSRSAGKYFSHKNAVLWMDSLFLFVVLPLLHATWIKEGMRPFLTNSWDHGSP